MLKSKSKYYFTRLDGTSQRIYSSILSAWESHRREPSVINPLAPSADLQKIIQFIAWDNPGLFYVDFSRVTILETAFKMTVCSEFLYSKRQIGEAEAQLEQSISSILSKYPFHSMDKYKKELTLHDYLAQNISYESSGISNSSASIVGGLLSQKAVCEGYSKTFKLLCDQVGLSCIMVSGTATTQDKQSENHAWNIVKLNGVCAHVDVTWDSTMRIGKEPCYDHFNITDDDISQDHIWDSSLLPSCTSTANNYFSKNGNLVRNDSELKSFIATQLKTGRSSFSVKLAGKVYDQNHVMNCVNDSLMQASLRGYLRNNSFSLRHNPIRNVIAITLT